MLTDPYQAQLTAALSAFTGEGCPPPSGYTPPEALTPLPEGTPMLLGYSGGIDSSVLLFLLYAQRMRGRAPLYLCHLHHGIRGEEADRDAEFVKSIADAYGLPLFLVHRDIPRIARENGESLEAAGRRIRYEVFRELMEKHGIPVLLTAHHADDTLETMLFHLLRGSGLSGLSGIPPLRLLEFGRVLRPLYATPRSEIEAFASAYGIPYVEDSTNSDTAYTRNRIRKEILPLLYEISPSCTVNAARSASLLRADRAYLEAESNALLQNAESEDGLSLSVLREAPDPILTRALLAYWHKRIPTLDVYEEIHLRALAGLARHGKEGEARSIRKSTARIVKGRLVIDTFTEEPPVAPFCHPINVGTTAIPERALEISLEIRECKATTDSVVPLRETVKPTRNIYNSATQIHLCFDTIIDIALTAPLVIRSRLPGDKILLRGMHRSLRTLCNEIKLTKRERERLLIVTAGEEIVWIPGLAVRDGVTATDASAKHLVLTLSDTSPQGNRVAPSEYPKIKSMTESDDNDEI